GRGNINSLNVRRISRRYVTNGDLAPCLGSIGCGGQDSQQPDHHLGGDQCEPIMEPERFRSITQVAGTAQRPRACHRLEERSPDTTQARTVWPCLVIGCHYHARRYFSPLHHHWTSLLSTVPRQ